MGISPFLSDTLGQSNLPLFIYTLFYFGIAYWLCMSPSKLVDRFGKVLTPTLLVLIVSIFVFSLFKPIGTFLAPIGDYAQFPLLKGFLEGYMTMDAIAALNFGIVISIALKEMGVKKRKRNCVKHNKSRSSSRFVIGNYIWNACLFRCCFTGGRFGVTENGGLKPLQM